MKKILRECPDFYVNHISFYLDGVSFIHKFNPMKDACQTESRVWRKLGEGLQLTAKGSKRTRWWKAFTSHGCDCTWKRYYYD